MPDKRRYFKELRMSQLRALVELERGNGFSGAAAALDLTTPSVWQQVRGLESEFELPLVDVQGQHVSLTKYGQLLVELAKPVVLGFDSLREQFNEQLETSALHLSVAAPNDILVNELSAPIREYRKQYPEVALTLIDCPSNPARKLLEDAEVELAVVGQLEHQVHKTLLGDQVSSFPFMLVCPHHHPLLKLKRVRPSNLAKYPLVMPNQGTNGRLRANEVFQRFGLLDQLRIAVETSTKQLLLRYVQMDFGIAVAPISQRLLADRADQLTAEQLEFRDVSDSFGHEHIMILRRAVHREPPHQTAFRECVLQALCTSPKKTRAEPSSAPAAVAADQNCEVEVP